MKFNYVQWVEAIEWCILQQLKPQAPELELLMYATIVLSMHGWERSDSTSLGYAAITTSVSGFVSPWIEQVWIEQWDDVD